MKKPTLISARSASKNASKPQQTAPSQPHPDALLSGVLAEKEAAGHRDLPPARAVAARLVGTGTCTDVQIIAATAAPLSPTSSTPDYGANGKPTPGRIVRLRLTGRDVPAMIHTVMQEATGACILTFADVPASVLDLWMRDAVYIVHRAFHAPFGHEDGCWDYWPSN